MSGPGFIANEPEQVCELCCMIAECRPYGPNGETVCFDCGMKNKEAAEKQMRKYLFGEKD